MSTPGLGIRVTGLSVRLGDRPVLDRVDLAVGGGELVALIGPNGAGKTTLLRAVLGLVPAERGEVRADRPIGYVPQRPEFAWDFPISVAAAVLTGRTRAIGWLRRPRAGDRAAVDQALERTGLTALRGRPIGQLSGGQRQRVLVARALALQPPALLLDEPFSEVDIPTRELLTGLLAELAGEGRAVLLTTHDLPAAAAACGRLCLLNRTVVAEGPPDRLRDPALWLQAFGVTSSAELLGSLGARP